MISDFNAFVGTWPFHRIRRPSFADLRALHAESGIGGGFVSSLEAIFWNDPYEAELLLARELEGSDTYRHVMTVDPMLSGTEDALRRGRSDLGIAGVRLLPGFHGYTLDDPKLGRLWDFLRSEHLPLLLTVRMEDERVTHMFHPRTVPTEETEAFLRDVTGFPVLLCNVRDGELPDLRGAMFARPDVFSDACGFKNGLFPLDSLYENGLTERIVYGSLAPIFCLRSTFLAFETADIPRDEIARMLTGEAFLRALE